jgi:hypothetical protein
MPRFFSLPMIASRFFSVSSGGNAAQRVIGAEFQNDAPGPVRDRPVHRARACRGGVAGNAGIRHRHILAFCDQRLLQTYRQGIFLGKLVAGHQAVAKADQRERLGGGCDARAEKSADDHG